MTSQIPEKSLERPDPRSVVLYLEVPPANVVLLQAYFELYESIGVCRTVDVQSSKLCILMPSEMLEDCIEALESIKEKTGWKFADRD